MLLQFIEIIHTWSKMCTGSERAVKRKQAVFIVEEMQRPSDVEEAVIV
jgi:hypothetical protein